MIIAGAAVAVYGLANAVATLTSDAVPLRVSNSHANQVTTAPWAPGGHLVAPYVVATPASSLPAAARWMVQIGHSLTPLLWAAAMVVLGLVLVRVGRSDSAFAPRVLKILNLLIGLLAAVALVPTGLVLFGTNMALGHLGGQARTYTDPSTMWIPLLAAYLGIGFRATLAHGAKLADELDQVI